MVCTHEILVVVVVGGGGLYGQIKSVVIKISFSKGGVTLWNASVKFWWGRGSTTSSQICIDLKYPLTQCNMMECICEIWGGQLHQVNSA